jgi:AraC family transcriptional regulator, positive regulator of tynA and feaB
MVDSATTASGGGSACPLSPHGALLCTDKAPVRERFGLWRDGVRRFFGVVAEAPSDQDFSGRAFVRSSGPFRFVRFESTSFQVAWPPRDADRPAVDQYSILLQLGGQTTATRGDDTVAFGAGDIGFCDGRRRRVAARFGGTYAVATMPRDMLERRAPWLRNRPLRKLEPNVRFSENVRHLMMELTRSDVPLSESQAALLVDSFCNLLALASAEDLPPTRMQGELQMEALLAFCRRNLGDAELSPQQAADHLGISVRTLHARFRQTGRSFGRWLLETRLEGCSAALRDANQRTLNISEIAWRWGFNDLSYFNKAFRAQFDMTPGEWREGETPS